MVPRVWSVGRLERLSRVLAYVLIAAVILLVNTEVIGYRLWPQVEYLYNQLGGIGLHQFYDHPHSHRYQLVRWIYGLSEWTGIDRHLIFANVCIAVLVLVSWVTSRTVVWRTQWARLSIVFLACFGFYFALSLFMNGRLIFGLLGIAWLVTFIRYFSQHENWKVVLVFIGALFLSGVTSGVFLSAAAAAFVAVLYAWLVDIKRHGWRIRWGLYLSLGVVGLVFLPIVHMMLFKNLDYYDRDLVKVVEHGMGQVITKGADFSYEQMLLNLVWVSGVLVMMIYLIFVETVDIVYRRFDKMLLASMFVLLTLSIFAYSIVSISVVFSLVVSLIIIIHVARFWRRYV